ncbi:type IV toxin-antitoxin system AbiEi family antitoxin domain-containing protein [Rothia mucilaginosa]|uniref:type IV toxin-antitoxin system AbiEi family antitoxin domain-containing protein n=1 Tax=Rothia mucilaginosa TaxID=43675 RepID=UPI003C7117BC
MLNLRGIGPKRIRKLVAEGSLQRIQRGAYIYTRDSQALTPEERLTVRCIAAQMMGLKGSSPTHQPRRYGDLMYSLFPK